MFLMAGPLSSEEIEDVVSSVRRLVSNEQSPRRVSRDLNADRLLLTPALRVVSEIAPQSPLILEAKVAEPEPDAPEQEDVLAGPVEAEIPADPVEEAEVHLIEAEWEDELWSPPEAASLGEVALGAEEAEILTSSAEEVGVETSTRADNGPDTWEQGSPDWVEDDPVPFIPLRRRAETLAARVASGEVMAASPAEATGAGAAGAFEGEADLVRDLELAALEMTAAELAGFDLDHEDQAKRSDDGDAGAAKTQRMPTEILDADGTPLAVLDEAALQDIVRQMIREELQGSLGERITRNVRKLVRAEINRALVARDLD
jgi:hypothetical protein